VLDVTAIFLILPALIVGICLGLIWQGKIPSLIAVVVFAGLVIGAMLGDWGGFFAGTFSSLAAFIHTFLILLGYFSLFLVPASASAMIAYVLKKQCLKWLGVKGRERP
jgi:hypothetical protein